MPILERHFDYNQVIISVVSFVVIALIIVIKLLFRDYFTNLFTSVFRKESLLRKNIESGTNAQVSFLAGIGAILSVSAAIMTVAVYFKIPLLLDLNPILFFLLSMVSVIVYYSSYKFLLVILGHIIGISEHTSVYSKLKSDMFKIMSLFLLPLFLIFPYADTWMIKPILITLLIIVIISLLINAVSLFSYLIKIKFFNHYAILYFCILEVLPLLIIAKVIGV